jgi:hypothetical protein
MGLFDKMWQALASEQQQQQQQQRPPPTTAPALPHPFGVILANQHPASMMLPIKGTFAGAATESCTSGRPTRIG